MTVVLQVRLLGQFRLTVDDQPVDRPTTARLQSLLAYLLLHAGAPQSRASLAFAFWPGRVGSERAQQPAPAPAPAAAGAARYGPLPARGCEQRSVDGRLVLSLDVAVFDKAVAEAEQAGRAGDAAGRLAGLERAVAICQGPLLPSCYDDWIGPARDRVSQRCKDAVASLVGLPRAAARVRGRHDARAALAWSTTRSTSGRIAG
jgi:DNA-binding SARP family transcriptional activator